MKHDKFFSSIEIKILHYIPHSLTIIRNMTKVVGELPNIMLPSKEVDK